MLPTQAIYVHGSPHTSCCWKCRTWLLRGGLRSSMWMESALMGRSACVPEWSAASSETVRDALRSMLGPCGGPTCGAPQQAGDLMW